ncbi:MAG: hypothetical protein ACD_11C00110G0011 [uncultured bacterium]|nr:MAG: hypothetical protein ACD_11C00110G0011 [uncultured bacterium]HBR71453.1 type IV pili twitching motility protein PilT [Candidatus Moranbacteria bacterium]
MLLDEILQITEPLKPSDVHIASDECVAIRINGEIKLLNELGIISKENLEAIAVGLVGAEKLQKIEETKKEFDFPYSHNSNDGKTRYRCNIFYRKGELSISLRSITSTRQTLDEIGVPEKAQELLKKKQGLILVSGPTGSGKSTTMAAMIDWINENRANHIVTIEDPIEHHITNNKCLVTQREMHSDTESFESSLRAALRQDPDIVVVGEMRDRETIEAVLKLCSAGHLVISTTHAPSASQTLYRILGVFPQEQHSLILAQLGESLLGILNQRLITTIQNDRTAIFEFMNVNRAIKSAIMRGDIFQLDNSITTGLSEGMVTFEKYLNRLIFEGKILPEAKQKFFSTIQ